MQRLPSVRSVPSIHQIVVAPEACLHNHHPTRLSNSKTNLRLDSLQLKRSEKGGSDGDLLSTYVELMRAAAMQRDPEHLAKVEKELLEPHGYGIVKLESKSCQSRPSYKDWHLKIVLSLPLVKLLVQKVALLRKSSFLRLLTS
jgi:hypothetical protein